MSLLIEKIKNHPKISIGIAGTLILGLFIRLKQHKMIYIPQYLPQFVKSPSQNPIRFRNPRNFGISHYQDLTITTEDGTKLKGWYISPSEHQPIKPKRLILYFHQNAGNIGLRLVYIAKLIELTSSAVMIVAYRGYSDSQGKPSQTGIKKDGVAILKAALQQAKARKLPLVIFGKSLGGAVAINSLTNIQQKQIKGLILQNTFTSISDVALNLFSNRFTRPLIKFLLFFLLTNHWQSYKAIQKIHIPTYFIKSARDELIPKLQMDQLQKRSVARNTMQHVIKFGTHNDTWTIDEKQYFLRFNQFLAKL